MTSNVTCVQCDRSLPQDALYCAFCGVKQPAPEASPEEVASPLVQARSESFVWDSALMESARRLLEGGEVEEASQELGSGDLRDLLQVSQVLSDPSMPAEPPDPAVAPALLPPRTMLAENYVIEDQIGAGGMGVVYRAQDLAMHRRVAVKVLHTNLFRKERVRQRFLREAQLMATLYHPHIVQVFDLLEEVNLLAIVMEYVAGRSLQHYLAAQTRQLPLASIRTLMLPVLNAMEEAHRQGIVHRDLKPGNLLLEEPPERLSPKISDFGLAKVLEGTNYTASGVLLGTCRYMSPEQFQSQRNLDQRTDIYALGVILYELCTGRCPFQESQLFALMTAHLTRTPEPPSLFRHDLPPGLEALVMQALAKDPTQRLSSCQEFAARLDEALREA